MADPISPDNPYVGPRAIESGEAFYGRDKEIRSISALLISERIVLLHSPSGAGKSSLIHAGLLPRMLERFKVFPVIRVNLEPPPELREHAALNRYLLSTLLALEEDLPPEKRLPFSQLVTLSIDEYLEQRSRLTPEKTEPETPNDLLIFDQFEEILTVSPTDIPVKQAFFEQLGKALQNRRRWALFAIREDFMGGLAPYVRTIPNRLNVTFRLGLLGAEAAKLAIQQPARKKDVDFTNEAAQKLVDDLRRIQVQQPDGSFISEEGLDIEPVQLQVVCFNLWQSHAGDDKIIDEDDLQRVGSVDQALASYYANAVQKVAESASIDQRLLRQWIDKHLITQEGIRSQVLKGTEVTEGLTTNVLDLLENTHLIRGELRAGKTWYELSHDRLVHPVRQDNTTWFEQNLSLLQRQSVLWTQKGRNEGLLLRGKALDEAERGLVSASLTPDEKDFIEACRKLQGRERQERIRNTAITILAIGATIAMVVAGLFYFRAQNSARTAIFAASTAQAASTDAVAQKAIAQEAQATSAINELEAVKRANIARAEQLSAIASDEKNDNYVQSLIFGAQALEMIENNQTRDAMLSLLQTPAGAISTFKTEHTAEVDDVVVSSNGNILASGGLDKNIILWDISSPSNLSKLSSINDLSTWKLAISSDNNLLAASGFDQNIVNIYDISNPQSPRKISQITSHQGRVFSLAFSPDNKMFASLSWDGYVILWDISNPQSLRELGRIHYPDRLLLDLAFSPDKAILATTSDDKNIILWDISNPSQPEKLSSLAGHNSGIRSVFFNQGGNLLVSGSYDGTVILWDVNNPTQPVQLSKMDGRNGSILAVALTPDEKTLAAGDTSGDITLWDITDLKDPKRIKRLHGHSRVVTGLAVNQDGSYLFSSSADHLIGIWNIDYPGSPATNKIINNPTGASFTSVAVSSDNKTLAVGTYKQVQLWNIEDINTPSLIQTLSGPDEWVDSVAFNQQGDLLASAGHGEIIIWKILDSGNAQKIATITEFSQWADGVVFSPDGKLLISVNKSGPPNIIIWDVSNPSQPQEIDEPQYHTGWVLGAAFSPDNMTFATAGSSDWNIALWETQDGKPATKVAVLIGHTNWVNTIKFSSDGKLLVSGDGSGNIILWDVSNAEAPTKLSNLVGHSDGITNFAFMDNGKTLASASHDGKVILWDITVPTVPEKIGGLDGHSDTVAGVVFLSSGNMLVSSSWDRTMIIWDLNPQSWLKKACQIAGRNFTQAEWGEYFTGEAYRATCPQWPPAQNQTISASQTP